LISIKRIDHEVRKLEATRLGKRRLRHGAGDTGKAQLAATIVMRQDGSQPLIDGGARHSSAGLSDYEPLLTG
jgi:hypothetical protein